MDLWGFGFWGKDGESYRLTLVVLLVGLFVASGIGCDDNDQGSTEILSLNGSLNGAPVQQAGVVCQRLPLETSYAVVVVARNLAAPEGLWLEFSSLEAMAKKVYTLPSVELTAKYSVAQAATGGMVAVDTVSKTENQLLQIAGSFDITFDGTDTSGNTTGNLTGTFNCTFSQ